MPSVSYPWSSGLSHCHWGNRMVIAMQGTWSHMLWVNRLASNLKHTAKLETIRKQLASFYHFWFRLPTSHNWIGKNDADLWDTPFGKIVIRKALLGIIMITSMQNLFYLIELLGWRLLHPVSLQYWFIIRSYMVHEIANDPIWHLILKWLKCNIDRLEQI